MSVYIVTKGEYSEYHIERVFSTRAKAEEFVGGSECGEFRVEEYPLDEPIEDRVLAHWFVELELETGKELVYSWTERPSYQVAKPSRACDVEICENGFNFAAFRPKPPTVTVTSVVSREHALKVAAEKRQEWLRTRGSPSA